MVNLITLMVGSTVFFTLILGLGYFLWIKTRPKSISWKADVYIEGGGKLEDITDSKGKKVGEQMQMKGIRPYTQDVIERIEKGHGKVIYRLVKLNKTTPEIDGDCVDYWGADNKRVAVLIKGETCTILRKGFNPAADSKGNLVFDPMPYEKVNMITNQMAIKRDNIFKEKDVLAAVLPYVAVVAAVIGLVAIGWVMGKSYVDMSENFKEAQAHNDEALIEASQTMADAMAKFGQVQQIVTGTGVQGQPSIVTS